MKTSQTKHQQLDELKARLEASVVTPEIRAQATQLVFGVGNPDADIVFVGEAPGKQEDMKGEPFVGAAGKLLDEMLASIGLDRSDIYITNIVKYRPPDNRDPLPEEKEAFWPYLQEQLQIIHPRVVVTLGRHSGGAFLPDMYISRDHGTPRRTTLVSQDNHSKDFSVVVLPLYHPAAALYNGGLRSVLMADFALIPEVLNKCKLIVSK